MKGFWRGLVKLLSPVLGGLFLCAALIGYLTPDALTAATTDSAFLNGNFPLSLHYEENTVTAAASDKQTPSLKAQLLLLGFFPVKEVNVTISDHQQVYVGGDAFGLRLYTDGLVVSSISSIQTEKGIADPAADAGLEQGDILLSVNGETLCTNEQLADIVTGQADTPLHFRVKRGERIFSADITPVYDTQTKSSKLGLHVRDSIAGIGTMTFIEPDSHRFAGLGHGLCDTASGCLMPLLNGDIVPIRITSVVKSMCGHPGTLCGSFADSDAEGTLSQNSEHGVYGKINTLPQQGELIPVAFRQEIVRGSAQLICTIDDTSGPCAYNVEIEDISYNDRQSVKNMVIHITDERLLRQTGGIVQGMSGSPILQNGQLAGALTHVFINDPTRGYAVFAETMTAFTDR